MATAQDPELGETGSAPAATKKRGKKRAEAVAQAEPAETPTTATDATPADPNRWGAAAAYGNTPTRGSDWERPPTSGDDGQPEGEESERAAGDSDHEASVGSFSLGFLGLAEVPVGVGDPVNAPGGSRAVSDTLTAPVIGTRYWFTPRIGVELGVGFMSRTGTIARGGNSNDGAKALAYVGTFGIPISLTYGKHYNVLLIPYGGFGASSDTDTRNTAEDADDVFGKGKLIEGGLKLGVETQLGAIGLPGLALQLAFGVRVRKEERTANVPVLEDGTLQSEYEIESNTTTIGTSPGSSVGSAVAGTIAALYYF